MIKILLFIFLIMLTSCMNLQDVNAGLWYSAVKTNDAYVDLLENKCDLKEEAKVHMNSLGDDSKAYYKEKYKDIIFANADICIDSLNDFSCINLKNIVGKEVEYSSHACKTTFSEKHLDACVSFNHYFLEIIKKRCTKNRDELVEKHLSKWNTENFYCYKDYKSTGVEKDEFPPREICMSKLLNLTCSELESYVGKNIESKLKCYMDGTN